MYQDREPQAKIRSHRDQVLKASKPGGTMKPILIAIVGCAALCAVLPAQYLEATIPVPQSPDVMVWNPANNRVYCAVGTPDAFGALAVIDGATNVMTDSVMLRCQMPGGIAVDPGSDRVFCAGSSYYPLEESLLTVVSGENDSILTEIAMGTAPRAVCYNPADNKLYCASQFANNIVIVDGSTYAVRATLPVPAGPCNMLYAPEVNKVYCAEQGTRGSPNFMVTVIDGATDSIVRTVFVGHYVREICYNPVDRKVYSADVFDGTVTVIDATADTVLARVRVGGSPFSLCWNPLLDRVYCADGDQGFLSVIDGATNALTGYIMMTSPAWQVTVDPAGGKAYCSNPGDNQVTVLDARTQGLLKTIDVGQSPGYLCRNPVNGRVYVGNRADNTVSVIRDSASSGTDEAYVQPVTGQDVTAAWPNPARGILYIQPRPGTGGSVSLYDPQGAMIARLEPGANDVRRLPAGTYFIRAAGDKESIKVVLR
jgi:YVTN family beta-propeller protein